MTVKELLDELNKIKFPDTIDIVLQADGLDTDAYFTEFDKSNKVLRIFGE